MHGGRDLAIVRVVDIGGSLPPVIDDPGTWGKSPVHLAGHVHAAALYRALCAAGVPEPDLGAAELESEPEAP